MGLVLLAGCSDRQAGRGRPDASDHPLDLGSPNDLDSALRDAAPADLEFPKDAGFPNGECAPGVTWSLQDRWVDLVALVDGLSRFGVTERFRVAVQLNSPCEVLAGIDVRITPGGATDFIGLAPTAWVPMGMDCPPSAPIVERIVPVPGREHGNYRVIMNDEHAFRVLLEYDREPCPGGPECACGAATPPGAGQEWGSCVTDCSCGEELSCIGYYGVAGPSWSCARTCSDFRDCDTEKTCLPSFPDSAPYVCGSSGDLCLEDEDCPAGFRCEDGLDFKFCSNTFIEITSRSCECDVDCPDGYRCIAGETSNQCAIACASDSWCPRPPLTHFDMRCTEDYVCVDMDPGP